MPDRDFSISASEDDREEWKAALTEDALERAKQTVCGFLNSFGGRVIFGVDPEGHRVALVGDPDKLQLRIHERVQTHLRPNARQHIDVALHAGAIFVFVRPDLTRLYQYRHVTYKRTGSSTHPLTHEQAKELEDQRKNHVQENAPGVFTRQARGEVLRCRNGHTTITGVSMVVSFGEKPGPQICPECGEPMLRA